VALWVWVSWLQRALAVSLIVDCVITSSQMLDNGRTLFVTAHILVVVSLVPRDVADDGW
jgi:hypothetical protein